MAVIQTDWQKEHFILPYVMLLNGAAALVHNAYELDFQLGMFFATGTVTLLYLFCRGKKQAKLPAMLFGPILLFQAWGILSLFWSINPSNTVWDLLRLNTYILTFGLIVISFSLKEVRKLYSFLIFVGVLVALFGIANYLALNASRIESTFINANPLGIFLGMMLLLTLARYLAGGSLLYYITAVIIGSGLLLSFSRGSLLAFGLGLVLLLSGQKRSQLKGALLKVLSVAILVIAFTSGIMQLAPYLQNAGFFNTSLSSSLIRADSFASVSVGGRWAFWQVAGRMLLDRPWTGVGLGNYHEAYMAYYGGTSFYSRYTHNHYLQTAAELGWPGLMFFMFILAVFIYRWISYEKNLDLSEMYYGAGAAALAFLAHILIDFSWDMPAVTLAFWSLLGIVTVLQTAQGQTKVFNISKPLTVMALALVLFSLQLGAGEYFLEKGAVNMRQGNPERAKEYLELAVRLVPWEPRYYSYLAGSLKSFGESTENKQLLKQALQLSQKASKLSPFNEQYLYQTGYLAWQWGDLNAAERYYRDAVRKGGFKLKPYIYLGEFYFFQHRLPEAENIYRQGAQLYSKAVAYAPREKVSEIQALQTELLLGLAQTQIALNKGKEARKSLLQALQLNPDDKQIKKLLETIE